MRSKRFWLALALAGHLLLQVWPAWNVIAVNNSGRDFASYYYGLKVAAQGGDPYETPALTAVARAEGSRKSSVQPYFYPPPFLLTMLWSSPLSLMAAYKGMFILNELCLLGILGVLAYFFEISLPIVALICWVYSPIPDNAQMGQANLLALFPALLGLALSRQRPVWAGILVGMAGMMKMSPALLLLHFALQRRWTAVGVAALTAVGLSVLALPWVDFTHQLRFYLEILPGFSTGAYNGLTVPITLNANHSIPDLLNRAFPSGNDLLSPTALRLSQLCFVASLGLWGWRYRPRAEHLTEELPAIGALMVWMVILPVYTYEHHLVFLIPAVCIAAQQAQGRGRQIAFVIMLFFLVWPLGWLTASQKALPGASAWIRESKFFAEMALLSFLYLWPMRKPALQHDP